MIFRQFSSPVPLGTVTTFRVGSTFEAIVEALRAWRVSRATRAALRGLSDEQLADLGLHRRGFLDAVRSLARR